MLVTVATFLEPAEAHIVRGRLEADGIPASIAHEGHVTANWPLATALGGVAVQVSSDDLEDARAIIDAYHRGDLADPALAATTAEDPCPQCAASVTRRRVPLGQKLLAIAVFVFGGATFPTRSSSAQCGVCGRRWDAR